MSAAAPPAPAAAPQPPVRPRRRLRLGPWSHLVERNLIVYRRAWMILVSGFFEPVFFLWALGVGVGRLVGGVELADGTTIPYPTFVAPALLAASAMNGALFESTINIYFKLRVSRTYDAVLATPVGPRDIALGEVVWSQMRGLLYATGFTVVMAAGGFVRSWYVLLAIPAAVLIGFAFAAVGMAAATWMRSWQDFDLVQLAMLPLLLFSTTFFPIDVYPPAIAAIVRWSPLYHGAELVRALALGRPDVTLVGHVAFLVAMAAVGVLVAGRRMQRLLLR